MTWRDFTIITLTNGRKEVYIIGCLTKEGMVELKKKGCSLRDDPENILVPKELVNSDLLIFQPVKKRPWWYQIFRRGCGYMTKKNGKPLMVKGGDLTKVLTKLHNGEMEEIIK